MASEPTTLAATVERMRKRLAERGAEPEPSPKAEPKREAASASAPEVRGGSRRGCNPGSDLALPPPPSAADAQHLVVSLEREFGLGDQPRMRAAFYQRVARWYLVQPQKVLDLVAAARMQARGMNKPGVYFVVALSRKLAEAFGGEVGLGR